MFYFKSGIAAYVGIAVAYFAVLLLCLYWRVNFLAGVATVLFFLCAIMLHLHYLKRYRLLVEQYVKDCDPQAFLERFSECLKASRHSPKLYSIALIQNSSALIGGGWFEQAIIGLQSIDQRKWMTPGRMMTLGALLNNMTVAYLCLGDFASADAALADFNSLLQRQDMPVNTRQELQRALVSQQYARGLFAGLIEGAEEYFASMSQISASRYEQMCNRFYLGWAQLMKGKKQEAAANLRFVAEGAPKLFIAGRAKEMLVSMEIKPQA